MHDVRLLSVKHFTFRLIYKSRGINSVRIFKFRVRGIPQVLDPLRIGSALMTCTGLQLHGLFLGGTHSAIASQIYKRYEALMRGPFASVEKTADPSPRWTATQSARHWPLAYIGLVSSDGPCRFFKSTIYRYV